MHIEQGFDHRKVLYADRADERYPVRIVNVTTGADIDKVLSKSANEKRASFDLDEVVFCNDADGVDLIY